MTHRVFLGNIPRSTTAEEVSEYFGRHVQVSDVWLSTKNADNFPDLPDVGLFCFVTVDGDEDMHTLLRYNACFWKDRKIFIRPARREGYKAPVFPAPEESASSADSPLGNRPDFRGCHPFVCENDEERVEPDRIKMFTGTVCGHGDAERGYVVDKHVYDPATMANFVQRPKKRVLTNLAYKR